MHKKIICIVILSMFLLTTTGISAFRTKTGILNLGTPPEEEWSKTFGGTGDDYGWFVEQTADGGYIIVGKTDSSGGDNDVWLIKTDSNGNKLWDKTFGSLNDEEGISGQQTSDGGYIIAGQISYSSKGGLLDIWLIKTDADGNKEWDKTIGGLLWKLVSSIRQTSDGGYIIVGDKGIPYNIFLIKTDSNGNKLWERTYGGINDDVGYSVQQTTDGGYIITGLEATIVDTDVLLIKTDEDGNKLWERNFGKVTDNEEGMSVQQTSDGGYIIAGITVPLFTGNPDAWLIKTDSNGNIEWDKTFGGANLDIFFSVQQTTDSGYILAGTTDSFGNGDIDVWLVKTDSNGNKLWDKTFGGPEWEYGWCVQQTSDGGFIIIGTTTSFGAGESDAWLIKMPDFENQRPESMSINGPSSGIPDETIEFTLSAIDPDGDKVYYYIDWGDCTVDEWIGPYTSGENIVVSHTWTKRGTYNIKAKAEDIYGGESDWDTLTVTMPRNKAINTPFLNWLQSYLNMFPILILLLQQLGLQ